MSYKHSSMSTCGVDQRRKAAGRRGQSIINRLSPAEIKAIEARINRQSKTPCPLCKGFLESCKHGQRVNSNHRGGHRYV